MYSQVSVSINWQHLTNLLVSGLYPRGLHGLGDGYRSTINERQWDKTWRGSAVPWKTMTITGYSEKGRVISLDRGRMATSTGKEKLQAFNFIGICPYVSILILRAPLLPSNGPNPKKLWKFVNSIFIVIQSPSGLALLFVFQKSWPCGYQR